ncbi:MAG: hypothetical protein MUP85_06810 [Candidatus Lokiarchaeota archaeon]|nr:hypothetical protein [Candidatus Lokiarchaeota archaeon]
MESLQTIQELKIPTNKLFYNKKTEVLSVYIMDLVFIGNYKKNTSLSKILDDIYESFGQTSLKRENLAIVEFVSLTPLAEKTKINKLALISKKEAEKPDKSKKDALGGMRDEISSEIVREKKKSEAPAKSAKRKAKKVAYDEEPMEYEEEELYSETDEKFKEIADFDDDFEETEGEMERVKSMDYMPPLAPRSAPPAPGGPPPKAPPGAGAPSPKPAAEPILSSIPEPDFFKKEVKGEEVKPSVYEINMGLQYYSVMMEKTSYLFYIYLSHKELKIMDEEGKTIFETSFIIKTTKKEPPVLNIKVEGEGFEVHPLFGRVEVKKDAINPPVMIFSVLPIKKKEKRTKKERKESERRHLHVYVEFEEKPINHSILSIIVQPKTFHVDIGPLHLDVSKKTAMIVSFISIIIAVASLMYTLFSIDPSSTTVDVVTNFAPGLGSIIFIGLFLYTLFNEGVRPLKEKISYFLNFDKAGMIVK